MTPERIGKYKVLRVLGRGAMGEVYLGEDPYIGRHVAIKLVKGAEPEARERFLHEARVVGGFSHPRIVLLLEFDFSGDEPFLVMEYLRGESLEAWMGEKRGLGAQLVILEDLFDALAYAHAQGVLHRDIKPSNLQVLPDGHAKLMDFGIARAQAGKLTATGTVVGTPNYMAPEILEDAQYSPRSDIYSAALLAYELLSGTNPFAASSIAACLNNVLHLEPPHLHAARPDVPARLAEALMAGLNKDPARRPELAALLEAVRAAQRPAAPPEEAAGETRALERSAARALPAARAPEPETQPIGKAPAPAPKASSPEGAPKSPPAPAWRSRRAALAFAALVVVTVAGLWLRPRVADVPRPEAASGGSPLATPVPAQTSPAPASTEPPASPMPSPSAAALSPEPVSTAAPRKRAEASPAPAPQRRGATARPPAGPAASSPIEPGLAQPMATPAPSPELLRPPATPEPTPAPAARNTPSPLPAGPAPTTLPAAQPVVARAPELGALSPRTARRGSAVSVELRGTGFRAEHKVVALQGRSLASGVRVLKQELVSAGVFRVQLLIDDEVPLGSYTLAVRGPGGEQSNGLVLEVVL